jgi:hypothetical protein
MKKILFSVLLSGLLFAADNDLYDNGMSLDIGYRGVGIDSGLLYGFRFDRNLNTSEGTFNLDAMQFVTEYIQLNTIKNDYAVCLGGNALWYIENDEDWMPYLKIGLGTQVIVGKVATNASLYGTLGAGIEYQMRPDTSFVLDVADHYTSDKINNLKASIGLKYSFGQSY